MNFPGIELSTPEGEVGNNHMGYGMASSLWLIFMLLAKISKAITFLLRVLATYSCITNNYSNLSLDHNYMVTHEVVIVYNSILMHEIFSCQRLQSLQIIQDSNGSTITCGVEKMPLSKYTH